MRVQKYKLEGIQKKN